MHDHRAAGDAVRPGTKRDAFDFDGHLCGSVRVGNEIAQIAGMARCARRAAMPGCGGIKMRAGTGGIRCPAIALLMDVNAVRAIGLEAVYRGLYHHDLAFLREVDGATDRIILGGRENRDG